MKVNRRLINIAVICFLIAAFLTVIIYNLVITAAQPEQEEAIAYFKYNMDRDTVIKDSDVAMVLTPKSIIPKTAIRDLRQIKDKKLVSKVEGGDMVLTGKLIERGDIRADVRNLWTVGIDVTNISSCLGGNIREGGEYVLLYKPPAGEVIEVSKVKVANLIDPTGKLITATGDGIVKTINISVDSKDVLTSIVAAKGIGTFEIVDAPEGYTLTSNKFEVSKQQKEIPNSADKIIEVPQN